MRSSTKYLLMILLAGVFASCKKWDDHIAVTNQDLTQNLAEAIASNPDLSTFSQYVKQSGADSILGLSKTFTVWAPSNAALQGMDPAVVNDPVKLRAFVLNHISNQSYFKRDVQSVLRIPMLNGKYNNFFGAKIEDANLTTADRSLKNGVLHTIDKRLDVLPNIWDYINANASQYTQNAFVSGLAYNDFDPSLATVDSISPITGQPIYKPGTGVVVKNKFLEKVYNLSREDKQFTYFLVANSGFQLESDSLKTYFATGNTASTDSLAKWNTVKDLVVEGLYPATALTGLVSKSGVSVPVNASNITQTIKLSNGVIYVMSKLDVPNANKFKDIRIEGEAPTGFSRDDKRSSTNYRIKYNPVTGQNYSDLMVSGHGTTGFYAYYRLPEMPTMKYKMYALGVNDFQTAAFPQRIDTKNVATGTSYASLVHNVPLNTATGAYNEVYLGDVTISSFGTVDFQLIAQNTPSGTAAPVAGTNPIVLDYIRLVPVL